MVRSRLCCSTPRLALRQACPARAPAPRHPLTPLRRTRAVGAPQLQSLPDRRPALHLHLDVPAAAAALDVPAGARGHAARPATTRSDGIALQGVGHRDSIIPLRLLQLHPHVGRSALLLTRGGARDGAPSPRTARRPTPPATHPRVSAELATLSTGLRGAETARHSNKATRLIPRLAQLDQHEH